MPVDLGRLLLLLVLFLSTVAAEIAGRQVVIALPRWADAPVCRIVGEGVVTEHTGHGLTLPCTTPTATLACDAANAEPLDLPLVTACRTREVPLQAGQPVEVELPHGSPVVAEWLEFDPGGEVRTVAVRTLESGNASRLLLARDPRRLIRLSVPGYSPLTARATPLVNAGAWPVPRFSAGGELIALAQPSKVRPERYRMQGPQPGGLDATSDGVLLASGLRPGRYGLTPVYPGGLVGTVVPFEIEDGRSSVIPIASEDVGEADITLDAALCAETLELRLDWLVPRRDPATVVGTPRGRVVSRRVVTFPHLGRCTHRIGGLAPGQYVVRASGGPSGLAAHSEFGIETDQTTPVLVETAVVRVSGRVLVNGQPFRQPIQVSFNRFLEPGRPEHVVSVPVESDGTYSASFAKPGEYRARLVTSSGSALAHEKSIHLTEPHTLVDWDVEGGTLRIEILNWDRTSPVEIQLRWPRQPEARVYPSTSVIVREIDELPVSLEGLRFDEYTVDARQDRSGGDMHIAPPESITLDAARPDATVRLRLGPYESVISVRDEIGLPIDGAQIATSWNTTLPQVEPGVFLLRPAMATPGDSLTVRAPGFVSVCRLAPSGHRLDVVLTRGAPVLVDLLTDQPLPDTPGRILWPGAECPVSLRSFERQQVSTGKGRITYLFPHFPAVQALGFLPTPFDDPPAAQLVRIVDGRLQLKLP